MPEEKSKTKSRMVSMRMTEEQYQMIISLGRAIYQNTGFAITKSSIMIKMMELGFPDLQQRLDDRGFWSEEPDQISFASHTHTHRKAE